MKISLSKNIKFEIDDDTFLITFVLFFCFIVILLGVMK